MINIIIFDYVIFCLCIIYINFQLILLVPTLNVSILTEIVLFNVKKSLCTYKRGDN